MLGKSPPCRTQSARADPSGEALRTRAGEQREDDEAVAAARADGRSRGEIGLVLGVSRQAARERYGQRTTTARGARGRRCSSTVTGR